MIVSEVKTKVMCFGEDFPVVKVNFNGKIIEQVTEYKYVGNVISLVQSAKVDIFACN